MDPIRLAGRDEVPEGGTRVFRFERDGVEIEAFLLRLQGRWLAYENVCRHIPVSLDYGDGSFLTRDRRHILCQNHGAVFDPHTGRCLRGPCEGAFLHALAVSERDGSVWLTDAARLARR